MSGLEKIIGWARMSFKPTKSRSLVLMRGKVADKYRFLYLRYTNSQHVREANKEPGKVFDSSLRDSACIKNTCEELEQWLKDVDKKCLSGKFKAWVYQHRILPRILLPLPLYEFPITTIIKASESLFEEMARAPKELTQHRSLWKHLQTETP